MLQRALLGLRTNLAGAQHVGLPQQDEHLDLLAHLRALAIGVGQLLAGLLFARVLLARILGGEVGGRDVHRCQQAGHREEDFDHGWFSSHCAKGKAADTRQDCEAARHKPMLSPRPALPIDVLQMATQKLTAFIHE